ncbi:MAG: hypothetical protein ACHQTE_01530 [Candidatus Saccharimonadales bacterium]
MNHFLNNPHPKPFHSSGYAQAAYGQSIGSTSPQTFNERYTIDNNRQSIRKYHESMVVHDPKRDAKHQDRIDIVKPFNKRGQGPVLSRGYNPTRTTRQTGIVRPERIGFIEPPTRRFDPFS